MTKLRVCERTHVGKVRKNNEDYAQSLIERSVFVLCDGMGGYEGGEVASRLAVTTVLDFMTHADEKGQEMTWPGNYDSDISFRANCLKAGIEQANQRILDAIAETPALQKMGTTIVGLVFEGGKAFYCHVGDSRGYLWRAGKLSQITQDHSFVGEQVRMGLITAEQAEHHAYKNVITRSLGMPETPKVDVTPVESRPGDIFVICSDGLSGMTPDSNVEKIITEAKGDLDAAGDRLIEAALEGGGKDNVTVTLVEYGGE